MVNVLYVGAPEEFLIEPDSEKFEGGFARYGVAGDEKHGVRSGFV